MSRSLVALLALTLAGCSTLLYYGHVLRGGWQVLDARRPIAELIADPGTEPALKARLSGVEAARTFAVTALDLPDGGSYRSYAALGRPYVVWNVFAAPELSLKPVEHCFPVAGCVAYRGYYTEALAKEEAAQLAGAGYETYVGGVAAYSTLGWFDDPVLSTMMAWDDDRLHAVLFHELAHQRAYVPGDTAFNESYGKFVEIEGLKQWRLARGLDAALPPDMVFEEDFIARLLAARDSLVAFYAAPLTEAAKRTDKAQVFAALKTDLMQSIAASGAREGYRRFVEAPMNNARLLPFGLYHQWRPAFGVLFAESGRDWPRFHAAVKAMVKLDAATRLKRLQTLDAQADASPHT